MSLELNDIEPKLQCRTSKNKSTENKKSLSKIKISADNAKKIQSEIKIQVA